MKILYAIQGTGNGHISRARDIIPILQQYGQVDILVSGTQADVNLDYKIKYQFHGLSFVFGKRGGVDIKRTLKQTKFLRLLNEIWKLHVTQYDLVINDFEPISAWACKLKLKKCIGLSHQSAVIHPFSPKPSNIDWLGYLILKFYAPVNIFYGFHFKTYADKIYTPVIRQEIRALKTSEGDFYNVYLPAYSDERIINILSKFNLHFKVFSKHTKKKGKCGNIEVIPIDNHLYLRSLAACKGVICGAGFEGPSEALFLRKKLLVIPMKGQYEQQCNAAALAKIGVKVLKTFKLSCLKDLDEFFNTEQSLNINYPNQTEEIIRKLVLENAESNYNAISDSFSFS